jgi:regulator of RNase E activity RraA
LTARVVPQLSAAVEGLGIAPGELIFGDREGALIIPSDVESEAVAAALDKASTENKAATAIRGGMSAREAFESFGVL